MSLTVIIPVFNAALTVERAILSAHSIAEGTEVICVDDASQDDSAARIASLQVSAPWLRLISLDRNMGVSAARNAGIEAASTNWITFLDADDVFDLDEKARTGLTEVCSGDYELAFFQHELKGNLNLSHDYNTKPGELTRDCLVSLAQKFLANPRGHSIITHCWGKVFQRKWLDRERLRFRENLRIYEDIDFVARCMRASSTGYFVDGRLCRYGGSHGLSRSFEATPLAFLDALEGLSEFTGNPSFLARANAVFFAKTLALTKALPFSRRRDVCRRLLPIGENISLDYTAVRDPQLKRLLKYEIFRYPSICALLLTQA